MQHVIYKTGGFVVSIYEEVYMRIDPGLASAPPRVRDAGQQGEAS